MIFGKTDVPRALMDGQSWNEIYGRTNNPWFPGRTPGGSSDGSAAAIAAGLTGLECGGDTVPPQERTLSVNGKQFRFENQLLWAGYGGVAYLPATVGQSREGLPIGVQIIGPHSEDRTCLQFAGLLEQQ